MWIAELHRSPSFVRICIHLTVELGAEGLVLFFQELNILGQLAIGPECEQHQQWVENLGHRGILGICDHQRCFTFVVPNLLRLKARVVGRFDQRIQPPL